MTWLLISPDLNLIEPLWDVLELKFKEPKESAANVLWSFGGKRGTYTTLCCMIWLLKTKLIHFENNLIVFHVT